VLTVLRRQLRAVPSRVSTQAVRVYHFVPARFGLDDLRRRRLKIARLHDLNDPFELWAIALPSRGLRKALREWKAELSRRFGLLCFSFSRSNPLPWSHYADGHRGIALGFGVGAARIKNVRYVEDRPILDGVSEASIIDLLYTKYVDWS
jgi:hypothetical protein